MRVRSALAIAIATPVLLATIGMTGASAATRPSPQKPTPEESFVRPQPIAPGTDGRARKTTDEDAEPEEGLLGTLAGELVERVGPPARR
ncbi:hypothetical protein BFF78_23075 [Streptomyces fodineus]|uniref:Uncharacterized protein n=1 Tax=Streptomyces fodineus TaxID=1904616 RepID=A0A1D7YD67_9ACTN|nr:hypothetical protein [Streptomyces fodineus]AOR33563.1 hypothetical protein BFF78_23075 [Streptomyces fodineus]